MCYTHFYIYTYFTFHLINYKICLNLECNLVCSLLDYVIITKMRKLAIIFKQYRMHMYEHNKLQI